MGQFPTSAETPAVLKNAAATARWMGDVGSYLNRQAIDVREFGATVDGSTDDSKAVQATLDYIASLPHGGTLFVPPGVLYTAQTCTYDANYLTICGAGQGISQWKFGNATRGLDLGNGSVQRLDWTIRNITLRGSSATVPATLVRMREGFIVNIVNCEVSDATNQLVMQTCGHVQIVGNTWSWNSTTSDQVAITMNAIANASVIGNSMEGGTGSSANFIYMSNASQTDSITICGNNVRQNHNAFVRINGSANVRNIIIVGNADFDSLEAGVYADSSATMTDCVIVGNVFNGRGSNTGIDLNNGTGTKAGLTVAGNTVTEYTTKYDINGTGLWTAATNTKSRATFDTTTVTLANLAAAVGQLLDDLLANGTIQ